MSHSLWKVSNRNSKKSVRLNFLFLEERLHIRGVKSAVKSFKSWISGSDKYFLQILNLSSIEYFLDKLKIFDLKTEHDFELFVIKNI